MCNFQIQKNKDKLKKNPPSNMSLAVRNDLLNSLTICAFLCQGLELLHNWGVRVFYDYLFGKYSYMKGFNGLSLDMHAGFQMRRRMPK